MTEDVHDEPPSDDDEVAASWDDPDEGEGEDEEVEPAEEPGEEPADPHQVPLDDDEDARLLDPVDPRRREAEQRRGRPFSDDEEADDGA